MSNSIQQSFDEMMGESSSDSSVRVVVDPKELDKFLSVNPTPTKLVGSDTEGSGLNVRKAVMYGVSFAYRVSPEEIVSAYVPVVHHNHPVMPREALKEVLSSNQDSTYLYYNAKYDRTLLQTNVKWVADKFLDVMTLVFLNFSDRRSNRLSDVVMEYFNESRSSFGDLFSSPSDFIRSPMSKAAEYCAQDSEDCIRVWERAVQDTYLNVSLDSDAYPFVLRVDNELTDVLRKIEYNGGFVLDSNFVKSSYETVKRTEESVLESLYRMAGRKFDPNSPAQVGQVLFEELEIPNSRRTKTGKYSTDAQTLASLAPDYPIVSMVVLYRKLVKHRSSFLNKLITLDKTRAPLRVQYHQFSAPTYRLASPGGSPEQDGFCGLNSQAVSHESWMTLPGVKIETQSHANSSVEHSDDEEDLFLTDEEIESVVQPYISDSPSPIDNPGHYPHIVYDDQGDSICIRDSCTGCLAGCSSLGINTERVMHGGISVAPDVHRAFAAPPGYCVISVDYSGQELMLAANFSQEPNLVQPMSSGGDVHATAGAKAYGHSVDDFMSWADDPRKRTEYSIKRFRGKTLNFSMLYGATYHTIMRNLGLSKIEAVQMYNNYRTSYRVLFSYFTQVQQFAARNGYISTYWGRRRYLKHFYDRGRAGDKRMLGFANRSAVNSQIQGTAADMCRIALVRLSRSLAENFSINEVRLAATVHDSFVSISRIDLLPQALEVINTAVLFNVGGWTLQPKVDISIGPTWGEQTPISTENFPEALEVFYGKYSGRVL